MTQQSQQNPGFSFFSVPEFLREHRTRTGTWLPGMETPRRVSEPTDFGQLVINALAGMTRNNGTIDQELIRMYLSLAPSYLVLDSSMNTEGGVASWNMGFQRLVEVLIALHRRGELELNTVNEASRACSECWSIAGSWRGLDECKDCIREIAGKLKTKLLDENGRTYKGNQVYAP